MPDVSANAGTFLTVLKRHAAHKPEHPALIFVEDGEKESGRITYGDLRAAAQRVASYLVRHGLVGERVLIACPSPRDFMVGFLGCLHAGAVAVPVPAGMTNRLGRRVLSIAANCRPALVLAGAQMRPGRGGEELAKLHWVTVAGCEGIEGGSSETHHAPADCGAGRHAADPPSLAMLQYTSGSTGDPRGVAITHANLMANFAMLQEAAEFGKETTVNWMPLHHDMGLIGITLQTLYGGGTCVLMSPMHFVQRPLRWLECISRYHATLSCAPTFGYRLCIERAPAATACSLDLSGWRRAIVGAEPVRTEVLDAFSDRFRPAGFCDRAWFPAYGLAEATVFATGGPAAAGRNDLRVDAAALRGGRARPVPEAGEGRVLVACGRPPSGTDLRVVDPTRQAAVPEATVGEIWLRGGHIASGYWENEASGKTFGATLDDGSSGWLRTGDLGFMSAGQIYLTGRVKDVLIVRGVNHYPQDLEDSVARSHAAFAADGGAAFTVEVEGEQQIVVAHEIKREAAKCLVPKDLAISAIREVGREHGVALYDLMLLRPRALPRTSSGKVQRHRCRSAYLEGTLPRLVECDWPGLGRFRTVAVEGAYHGTR